MLSDLEIMMAAGHPKREAEKHLKDGSLIYSDLEEHFDSYMDEFFYDYDEQDKAKGVAEFRRMIDEKVPVTDWDCVKVDGKWYYIEYCL